jgi:hypothetical protein
VDREYKLMDDVFLTGPYDISGFTVQHPYVYPTAPMPYSGPIFEKGVTNTVGYLEKISSHGLGLLTADVLTKAAGGKSFGTLGEGNLKTFANVEIPNTVTTYGSKFKKEDPSACDASYQIITVIPKSSQSSKTFTATFGSYPWKHFLSTPSPSVTMVKSYRSDSNLKDPKSYNYSYITKSDVGTYQKYSIYV